MRILIDMNLPPRGVGFFATTRGWDAVHWSNVGDPRASDHEIMAWAKNERRIVFTHDLDFGALLAETQAEGPSVIQVRTRNILPDAVGHAVMKAMDQFERELERGALVTVDSQKGRPRILPIE